MFLRHFIEFALHSSEDDSRPIYLPENTNICNCFSLDPLTFQSIFTFHAFKHKFKSFCKNVWIFGSDDVRKHRKKAGNEFQGPSSKSWLQKKKKKRSSKAETLYQRKDLCCHGDQAFLFPVNIYRLQDEPHPLLATASFVCPQTTIAESV